MADYPDKPPPYSPPNTEPKYSEIPSSVLTPQQEVPHPPPPGPYGAPSCPPYSNAPPQPPLHTFVGPHRSYGTTTVTVSNRPTEIIFVGGCPACKIGVLEDDFTCLGLFCAIFFFPLGILFCLALRRRRCANCGAIFG